MLVNCLVLDGAVVRERSGELQICDAPLLSKIGPMLVGLSWSAYVDRAVNRLAIPKAFVLTDSESGFTGAETASCAAFLRVLVTVVLQSTTVPKTSKNRARTFSRSPILCW